MIRPWLLGLAAGAAAFVLCRNSSRVVPAEIAAERLRRAWADYHTVA